MGRLSLLRGGPIALLFLLAALVPLRAGDGGFSAVWWNIENFGEADRFIDDRRVDHAMKPPSEINAVVAILKRLNPDILGVAEVIQAPADRYLKLLQSLLKQAGLDYPYVSTAHGEDTRIQAVLFSRFPIRAEAPFVDDSFPVTLASPGTGEEMASRFRVGRGFVNAQVEVAPGVLVQVMLAHLKSKRAEPGVAGEGTGESGDEVVRHHEAEALRRHLDDFVRDHPAADLLVMGDFNDGPNSRSLRPVMGKPREPLAGSRSSPDRPVRRLVDRIFPAAEEL